MTHWRIKIVFAAAVALGGCGNGGASDGQATERDLSRPQWRVEWLVGGTAEDTLLLLPWRLAVGEGAVYVVDRMGARVAAFSRADGSLLWMAGSEGRGPGQFLVPNAIAVSAGGTLWVSDPPNGRITRLGPHGRLKDHLRLDESAHAEALCALGDGTMLGVAGDPERPLWRWSADGRRTGRHALPWRDLRGRSPLLQQAYLAGDEGSRCLLALKLGRGFAAFDAARNGFEATHRYVEDVPLPEVSTRESGDGMTRSQRIAAGAGAAIGAVLHADTLTVAFEGNSEHRYRLLDHYSSTTGSYLGSVSVPWTIAPGGLAYEGGTYYFISRVEGSPVLIAATAEPPAPRD